VHVVTRAGIYRIVFTLAGAYNIAFGSWAALAPRAFFRILDLGEPSHPAVWACLGMVVGLYGLIYLQIAFTDPERGPSTLVAGNRRVDYDVGRLLAAIGLAGKILGPIGFVIAVRRGELPMRMLSLLVWNDLIWWAPFAMYLADGTSSAATIRRRAPQICAAVHVAAAVATLVWIREGSEAVREPAARAAYIASHASTWTAAWMIWMAAGVTLVGFFCWWAVRAARRRLATLALAAAFAGLAVDLFADSLFAAWTIDRYAAVARATTFLSEVVANGLYSIAGALLMIASPPMVAGFAAWGWSIWLAGLALAVFGALRWDAGIVLSSGVLLALFIPWVWLAARRIGPPS
jgi:hypothetical protein